MTRARPEEILHRAVAGFLRLALMGSECIWYHCPNGEIRSKATAGKLKAMGVRAGTPDLCFILPGGHAGFIELKADGGLSPAQRAFRDDCERIGAKWALCRSLDDVAATLNNWRVPLHATLHGRALAIA